MRKIKNGVLYLIATVFICVCCGGAVYGVMPFGAAMYCALASKRSRKSPRADGVLLGAISAEYILFSYVFTFDVRHLYTAGAAVFIMVARWLIALKAPKLDNAVAQVAFSLFAVVINSLLVGVFTTAASGVISGFIGAAFFCFAMLAAGCAEKRFAFRLSPPEALAMCIILAVAGLAFGRARFGYADVGAGLVYFTVLMLTAIGMKPVLGGTLALALGMALVAPSTALALIGGAAATTAFRALPRPAYAAAGVGAMSAFGVLFGFTATDVWCVAVATAISATAFSLVPRKLIKRLREYFDFDGTTRLAVRHYINRVKADAGNRMLTLSAVFDETARLLGAFGGGTPDAEATGRAIADGVCPYCAKRNRCDKARASEAFTAVAERAQAGKAVLTELPEFFTAECAHTAEILSAAGALSVSAREQKKRTESEDKAREIVSERLAAVKDVLCDLGRDEATPVGFDGDAEDMIKSELAMRGVECAEAFVAGDNVTAVVRSEGADKDKLRRAVSCCMKRKYVLSSLEKTQASGWSVATFKKRPRYEAVYARAGVSKSGGISGDSYTFERIGDRFLVALLDGMGSGAEAGAGSDAAIELIQRFYKAGFDSEAALSGVNRFLKLPGGESFSAADVAVCDLDTAAVDIIKLGAPPCYIKTADTVLKIEGGSLPIGVLDEMRPYVTAKRLYPGQMLVMVTDGVSDCFDGDGLPMFINELKAFNPERTAEAILSRALKTCGDAPKDDMTVVAFRLFEEKN
ncbi:MAG: SpoIIE family protein phosphatase, partial [Clostridiales bacterium]|nr:SpoIIE family protein phosphatase [Clostridiales bacterium]